MRGESKPSSSSWGDDSVFVFIIPFIFDFILGFLPLSKMGGKGCKFECFSIDSDWRFSVSLEDVLLMGTCAEISVVLASFGKLQFSPSLLKIKIEFDQIDWFGNGKIHYSISYYFGVTTIPPGNIV